MKEFIKFLKEFNVVALAIGFVMGSGSTAVVNALVNDIVMPILAPLLKGGEWKEAVLHVGPVNLLYGAFLGEVINFFILALIVFFIARKLLKIEKAP